MTGLTLFYTIVVILVMVAAVFYWVMSGRSRQNPTAWLMGLGVIVLIGAGAILFGAVSGWKFPGLSLASTAASQPQDADKAKTPSDTPNGSTAHASGNKWAELQRLAPGLLPNCFQGAGLNDDWDFVTASNSNNNAHSLVVAFVRLTFETATKFQKACKEPNLGTPQENEAYVAMFAQAREPADLQLGNVTFSQDEKQYNVTEYLIDDQRAESERWITQAAPWLTIAGNFPSAPYLLAQLAEGAAGRSIGLIALPTGAIQAGKATLLDPTRRFQVSYGNAAITLVKP